MKRFFTTRTIAGLGMLTAMVVALQLLSNYVQFGPVSITLALFPIAVGAMLFGPLGGLFLGLVDGAMVLLAPSTISVFFAFNPAGTIIVCLSKTGLAGLIAGVIYKLLQEKNYKVGIVLASLSVPLINTGLFAIAGLTIFRPLLAGNVEGTNISIPYMLFIIWIGWNFFIEFGLNAAIAPAIFTSYKYIEKKVVGQQA